MQNPEVWINEHEAQLIDDICSLVRIPSVSLPGGGPAAPYGPPCLDALEASLTVGERMGFIPFNHENYCGSLLWRGECAREIGVFGHTDVVPAGGGWTYPPFEPVVQDGTIIGRGASDNKGSFLAALYALYYLKDQGYQPKNSFRFFLGCSEEEGMDDLEYYLKHHEEPVFSIVPDAPFPVCHGEKGILRLDAEQRVESGVLLAFSAGVASNVVPSEASALLRMSSGDADAIAALGASVEELPGGQYSITVSGKAAHAAFPEGSDSAEVKLARILVSSGVLDPAADKLMRSICALFADYYGGGIGVPLEDSVSGKLTHIGGLASLQDGVFRQSIDVRYNVRADAERMITAIQEALGRSGFEVANLSNSAPLYVDPEDPVVQRLMEICRNHLQPDCVPYIMGGGTYARLLRRAVAFGPDMRWNASRFGPDRGGAHQPDEYVEIADLKKAFLIYVDALQALDKLI